MTLSFANPVSLVTGIFTSGPSAAAKRAPFEVCAGSLVNGELQGIEFHGQEDINGLYEYEVTVATEEDPDEIHTAPNWYALFPFQREYRRVRVGKKAAYVNLAASLRHLLSSYLGAGSQDMKKRARGFRRHTNAACAEPMRGYAQDAGSTWVNAASPASGRALFATRSSKCRAEPPASPQQ